MDTAPTPGLAQKLRRPRNLFILAAVAVALIAAVLYWFQPQALLIDKVVNEGAPGTMEKDDAMAEEDAMAKEDGAMEEADDKMAKKDDAMMEEGDAMMAFTGSFRSIDHETEGSVNLAKAPDGHYYVRLEDFRTENGPDLLVYLSSASASADGTEYTEDFVDLGALKGNIGNQNYMVPAGTDLSKYKSVVIWCRRFKVAFGSAPLEVKQ